MWQNDYRLEIQTKLKNWEETEALFSLGEYPPPAHPAGPVGGALGNRTPDPRPWGCPSTRPLSLV